LTAVTTAILFLLALFFYPAIAMIGSYPAITAPALVLVGCMMMQNVIHLKWDDITESVPAFLTMIGIPLTYSIADGLALGFIAYPVMKLLSGRRRELSWLTLLLASVLLAYFLLIRSRIQ